MISIALPVHDMEGGEKMLSRCLDSILSQTYEDLEVVVTDNSEDDNLKKVCERYGMKIRWSRNPNKGMAQNTNEAIRLSKGDYVKILYMDDFFAHTTAIQKIVSGFDHGRWLVTGCNHTDGERTFSDHTPKWNPKIGKGVNTIGSPSILTMDRTFALEFDENLTWLLDCELYCRLYGKYGEPVYLKDINVTIGLHPGQATNLIPQEVKTMEYAYLEQLI